MALTSYATDHNSGLYNIKTTEERVASRCTCEYVDCKCIKDVKIIHTIKTSILKKRGTND